MNTKHYWSILFLLISIFISLGLSLFLGKNTNIEEGLTDPIATPKKWFSSPYTQQMNAIDLQVIISQLQKNPLLLDVAGTLTGIMNNPTIMNDPTIADAIASNPTYMGNSKIKSNSAISAASKKNPLINPVLNMAPLSSENLQLEIAKIQMSPDTTLNIPGEITKILNNPTIMDDPTVAAAIANNPLYSQNTIISVYPSVFGALANNTVIPTDYTAKLSPYKIQQQISTIQKNPTQLDVPGQITTILNNQSIMNDPTVTAAIVNDKTYMNNPQIVKYITTINPNAIANPNTYSSTGNPFKAALKQLISNEISDQISQIHANPAILDQPGIITVILNNNAIMDDATVAGFIIMNKTYMHNNFIATYPSITTAYNKALKTASTTDNPSLPVAPLQSNESFSNISDYVDTNIIPYTVENISSDTYNKSYTRQIIPSWKSTI